eukprot:5853484-Alexandrium_andersonii.AAC.1
MGRQAIPAAAWRARRAGWQLLAVPAPPGGSGRAGGVVLAVPDASLALVRAEDFSCPEGQLLLADLEGLGGPCT